MSRLPTSFFRLSLMAHALEQYAMERLEYLNLNSVPHAKQAWCVLSFRFAIPAQYTEQNAWVMEPGVKGWPQ
jgi:hypothetical protein